MERYQFHVINDLLPDLLMCSLKLICHLHFWHLELDDESSMMTTFATLHGRYRWLCFLFGLCVSSEIYQKHLHQELQGPPGIACIANDERFCPKSDVDHDSNLESFMKKCHQKGIKLIQERSPHTSARKSLSLDIF